MVRAAVAFSLILAIVQMLTMSCGVVIFELPWGHVGMGGLLAALTTVVCLVAVSIPLFLVLYVTRLTDLTNALVKNAHVPYRYTFTFASTVRFIPLFMNDMKGIMEAQTVCGVEFDAGGGALKKARLMAPPCIPLLVGSVRKANGAAIAAEVRGFYLRSASSAYREYPLPCATSRPLRCAWRSWPLRRS